MPRSISKSTYAAIPKMTTTFQWVVLSIGCLLVTNGCARSVINQKSPGNDPPQSMRRASAAATPIRKSPQQTSNHARTEFDVNSASPQRHLSTPSKDAYAVQTVGYEEQGPAAFLTDGSTPTLPANQYSYSAAQNSPRVPSHMLPISNMRPVPMNGAITSPNLQHGAGPRGCGGKCCSPQEGYAPIYPQFSTRGDLSTCGSDGLSQSDCGTCSNACAPLPYPAQQLPRYLDPQEYVYDGGDRAPEARLRTDLSVVGLDSEDTVIRYETTSGSVELQTGCRVPIYSPRFSSIRKIVSLNLSEHAVATQATLLEENPTRVAYILPAKKLVKNDGPVRESDVKVIEALRDRNRGIPILKIIPALDISDAFKPYEDLAIIRNGVVDDRDRPRLIRSSQAALNWTSVDQPTVLIHNVAANIVESADTAQELFSYELGNNRVRLCKVASHQVAEPGDIIDFTIRFDNTGDQKITNIMIQDSLAPRLEYVEDSQKSSIESKFSIESNDAGSSTLTWNITQEVAPGTGGFLRFQCKVR